MTKIKSISFRRTTSSSSWFDTQFSRCGSISDVEYWLTEEIRSQRINHFNSLIYYLIFQEEGIIRFLVTLFGFSINYHRLRCVCYFKIQIKNSVWHFKICCDDIKFYYYYMYFFDYAYVCTRVVSNVGRIRKLMENTVWSGFETKRIVLNGIRYFIKYESKYWNYQIVWGGFPRV